MRTAITLHGQLRTFFMPTRETGERLCDRFIKNILEPNGSDVFIYTDTGDFYHDGCQFYPADRKVEILNNNSWRVYNKVDFIDSATARSIIQRELCSVLAPNLKGLIVEDPYDATKDPKYNLFRDADVRGSSPTLLIHQWRKLQACYKTFKHAYEYDLYLKWRPDNWVPGPLIMAEQDWDRFDLYVAGGHDKVVFDWHAFGRLDAMKTFFNLYDDLGCFLPEGKVFLPDGGEITLAPEYHVWRLLKERNIRYGHSGYAGHPYRYKDPGDKAPIEEVMKSIGAKDFTLVNHTASNQSSETRY